MTDLLGTRRTHAPLGLVELYTSSLKWQTAIVKDAPHAALEIVNQILVSYAQDAAGKDCIPMIHKLDICAVIAGDILNPVCEFLTLRESLFKVTETARHRIAARIDNLGIGQDQMN